MHSLNISELLAIGSLFLVGSVLLILKCSVFLFLFFLTSTCAYVPNVTSFFGLAILDCPFGFL